MTYYDDPNHVQQYIDMAEGYDGCEMVAALTKYLPEGAKVLELGMGPSIDLELLAHHYRVTGSDISRAFLDRFRNLNQDADLVQLDAETIKTTTRFNGIYSNKVLHHLSPEQLHNSFLRQHDALLNEGIALHSFWLGNREETMHGLHFQYYQGEFLHSLVEPSFTILESTHYSEFEHNDSLYLVIKKINDK